MESERREFFRLKFSAPVRFEDAQNKGLGAGLGKSQDISQTGILFQTENDPPKISSILWMNVDLRTLKICQEIESKALIFNNGLLGKVVRVEEDPSGTNSYDVGVCFIKKEQRDNADIQSILSNR